MPRCPRCSTEVPVTQRFCGGCGAPVSGSSETGTATVVGPAARPSSTSTPEEGRFAPGTVLAQRYRISGKLGQGGMGEVYRAADLLLGQAVALKFLAAHRAAGETTLERFRNEVRLARQVSHPNVCRVYDIGEIEGSPFLFACSLLEGLCGAHHVAAIEEVVIVLDELSMALFQAGSTWALYMALEPYVRRRWPQSLIGWTRLLSDGIRDPLVGAQLLIGCAVGVVSSLLVFGWDLVFVQYRLFHPYPLLGETLVKTRRMAGLFFGALIVAIGYTLGMFFFFLLRALLRRQWLVWTAWVLVCTTPLSRTYTEDTRAGNAASSALRSVRYAS